MGNDLMEGLQPIKRKESKSNSCNFYSQHPSNFNHETKPGTKTTDGHGAYFWGQVGFLDFCGVFTEPWDGSNS